MKKKAVLNTISFFLAALLLTHNCILAHAAETNFWSERNRSTTSQVNRYAGIPAGMAETKALQNPFSQKIINQLPNVIPAILENEFKNNPGLKKSTISNLIQAIPVNDGSIRKITNPNISPDKTIIHIQDIHLNPEAQKNIASTVKSLINSGKVDLVALEGSSEEIPVQIFKEFPNQSTVQKVSNFLIRTNKISGPILAGLLADSPTPLFIGIDDKTHYQKNIDAYLSSRKSIDQIKKRLELSKERIDYEKKQSFNPSLLTFDTVVQQYQGGIIQLGEFVNALVKTQSIQKISLSLETFLIALNIESSLNFDHVQSDRSALLSELMGKLDKVETEKLIEESVAYRLGRINHTEFYSRLKTLCESKSVYLKKYPAMNSYLKYLLLTDSVDIEKISVEIKKIELDLYKSFTRNTQEASLLEKSKYLYLAGKLLDFSLSSDEWVEYKSINKFDLIGDLSSFENFYKEAEIRDQLMASNLQKVMQQHHSKVAILVTGGFHAGGIGKKIIQENKNSTVISFTPKLTKVESLSGSSYLSVFAQEKTPLEKIFNGEKLFLAQNPFSLGTQRLAAVSIAADELKNQRILISDINSWLRKATRWSQIQIKKVSDSLVYLSSPHFELKITLSDSIDQPFKISITPKTIVFSFLSALIMVKGMALSQLQLNNFSLLTVYSICLLTLSSIEWIKKNVDFIFLDPFGELITQNGQRINRHLVISDRAEMSQDGMSESSRSIPHHWNSKWPIPTDQELSELDKLIPFLGSAPLPASEFFPAYKNHTDIPLSRLFRAIFYKYPDLASTLLLGIKNGIHGKWSETLGAEDIEPELISAVINWGINTPKNPSGYRPIIVINGFRFANVEKDIEGIFPYIHQKRALEIISYLENSFKNELRKKIKVFLERMYLSPMKQVIFQDIDFLLTGGIFADHWRSNWVLPTDEEINAAENVFKNLVQTPINIPSLDFLTVSQHSPRNLRTLYFKYPDLAGAIFITIMSGTHHYWSQIFFSKEIEPEISAAIINRGFSLIEKKSYEVLVNGVRQNFGIVPTVDIAVRIFGYTSTVNSLEIAKYVDDEYLPLILNRLYSQAQGFNVAEETRDIMLSFINTIPVDRYQKIFPHLTPELQKYLTATLSLNLPQNAESTSHQNMSDEDPDGIFGFIYSEKIPRVTEIVPRHQGRTTGRLLILKETEPDHETLRKIPSNVIVAMEYLPTSHTDIGPFKGIITFRKESETSHAQTRAREWNVPAALFPSADHIPAQSGDIVTLEVKGSNVSISQASKEDREAYLREPKIVGRAPKVTLPSVNLGKGKYFIRPEDPEMSDPSEVGEKAAALNFLATRFNKNPPLLLAPHIQVTVARGYSLPFRAFPKLLHLFNQEKFFNFIVWKLSQLQETDIQTDLKTIRRLFLNQQDFPSTLKNYFKELGMEDLWERGYFIRPSTNAEDLPHHPGFGSGVYETIANVKGEQEFFAALMQAYAACYSDRAFWDRRHHEVDESKFVPSIWLVQSQPADYAFMIQTSNVATGDPDTLVIEVVQGLGESLASNAPQFAGLPSRIYWNKKTHSITLKTASDKKYRVVLANEGGIKSQRTEPAKEFIKISDFEKLVESLGLIGEYTEKTFGTARQIEGNLKEDTDNPGHWKITLFQAPALEKPVTDLSKSESNIPKFNIKTTSRPKNIRDMTPAIEEGDYSEKKDSLIRTLIRVGQSRDFNPAQERLTGGELPEILKKKLNGKSDDYNLVISNLFKMNDDSLYLRELCGVFTKEQIEIISTGQTWAYLNLSEVQKSDLLFRIKKTADAFTLKRVPEKKLRQTLKAQLIPWEILQGFSNELEIPMDIVLQEAQKENFIPRLILAKKVLINLSEKVGGKQQAVVLLRNYGIDEAELHVQEAEDAHLFSKWKKDKNSTKEPINEKEILNLLSQIRRTLPPLHPVRRSIDRIKFPIQDWEDFKIQMIAMKIQIEEKFIPAIDAFQKIISLISSGATNPSNVNVNKSDLQGNLTNKALNLIKRNGRNSTPKSPNSLPYLMKMLLSPEKMSHEDKLIYGLGGAIFEWEALIITKQILDMTFDHGFLSGIIFTSLLVLYWALHIVIFSKISHKFGTPAPPIKSNLINGLIFSTYSLSLSAIPETIPGTMIIPLLIHLGFDIFKLWIAPINPEMKGYFAERNENYQQSPKKLQKLSFEIAKEKFSAPFSPVFSSIFKQTPHLPSAAERQIREAGGAMNLTENEINSLINPKNELSFRLWFQRDDGRIRSVKGYRIQHNNDFGPYKGGTRWAADVSSHMLKELAHEMTNKVLLHGLPLGGGKGGIRVDTKGYSKAERARLMRAYARDLVFRNAVGVTIDVPAPDVGTDSFLMSIFADESIRQKVISGELTHPEMISVLKQYPVPFLKTKFGYIFADANYPGNGIETPFLDTYLRIRTDLDSSQQSLHGVVTGKPPLKGGLTTREKATGLGTAIVAREAVRHFMKHETLRGIRVAIQGFGNVGVGTAIEMQKMGALIVAIGEIDGGLSNPKGIDVEALRDFRKTKGTFRGFEQEGTTFDPNLIGVKALFVDADIAVPAARENQLTKANVSFVKAPMIVEAANGPTTVEAEDVYHGILVPDVLVNSGGVKVSFDEMQENLGVLPDSSDSAVSKTLDEHMTTVSKKVFERADKDGITLRQAVGRIIVEVRGKSKKFTHPTTSYPQNLKNINFMRPTGNEGTGIPSEATKVSNSLNWNIKYARDLIRTLRAKWDEGNPFSDQQLSDQEDKLKAIITDLKGHASKEVENQLLELHYWLGLVQFQRAADAEQNENASNVNLKKLYSMALENFMTDFRAHEYSVSMETVYCIAQCHIALAQLAILSDDLILAHYHYMTSLPFIGRISNALASHPEDVLYQPAKELRMHVESQINKYWPTEPLKFNKFIQSENLGLTTFPQLKKLLAQFKDIPGIGNVISDMGRLNRASPKDASLAESSMAVLQSVHRFIEKLGVKNASLVSFHTESEIKSGLNTEFDAIVYVHPNNNLHFPEGFYFIEVKFNLINKTRDSWKDGVKSEQIRKQIRTVNLLNHAYPSFNILFLTGPQLAEDFEMLPYKSRTDIQTILMKINPEEPESEIAGHLKEGELKSFETAKPKLANVIREFKFRNPSSWFMHLTGSPTLSFVGNFVEITSVIFVSTHADKSPFISLAGLALLALMDSHFYQLSLDPNLQRGSPFENLRVRFSAFINQFNIREFISNFSQPQFTQTFFIYFVYFTSFVFAPNSPYIFILPALLHLFFDTLIVSARENIFENILQANGVGGTSFQLELLKDRIESHIYKNKKSTSKNDFDAGELSNTIRQDHSITIPKVTCLLKRGIHVSPSQNIAQKIIEIYQTTGAKISIRTDKGKLINLDGIDEINKLYSSNTNFADLSLNTQKALQLKFKLESGLLSIFFNRKDFAVYWGFLVTKILRAKIYPPSFYSIDVEGDLPETILKDIAEFFKDYANDEDIIDTTHVEEKMTYFINDQQIENYELLIEKKRNKYTETLTAIQNRVDKFRKAKIASLQVQAKNSQLILSEKNDLSETIDTRPIRSGLLDSKIVSYDMNIKRNINPDNRLAVGVYVAAGLDLSRYLLTTNTQKSIFIGNYHALTVETLRHIKSSEISDLVDPEYSMKVVMGWTRSVTIKSPRQMVSALAVELKGLGVDLNKVQVKVVDGFPAIIFPWHYWGSEEKQYTLLFINEPHIETPFNYLESTKKLLDKGFDVYYQRGAENLPSMYVFFINYYYSRLKNGGFMVTNDIDIFGKNFSDDLPVKLKLHSVSKPDFIHQEYGKTVSARQKLSPTLKKGKFKLIAWGILFLVSEITSKAELTQTTPDTKLTFVSGWEGKLLIFSLPILFGFIQYFIQHLSAKTMHIFKHRLLWALSGIQSVFALGFLFSFYQCLNIFLLPTNNTSAITISSDFYFYNILTHILLTTLSILSFMFFYIWVDHRSDLSIFRVSVRQISRTINEINFTEHFPSISSAEEAPRFDRYFIVYLPLFIFLLIVRSIPNFAIILFGLTALLVTWHLIYVESKSTSNSVIQHNLNINVNSPRNIVPVEMDITPSPTVSSRITPNKNTGYIFIPSAKKDFVIDHLKHESILSHESLLQLIANELQFDLTSPLGLAIAKLMSAPRSPNENALLAETISTIFKSHSGIEFRLVSINKPIYASVQQTQEPTDPLVTILLEIEKNLNKLTKVDRRVFIKISLSLTGLNFIPFKRRIPTIPRTMAKYFEPMDLPSADSLFTNGMDSFFSQISSHQNKIGWLSRFESSLTSREKEAELMLSFYEKAVLHHDPQIADVYLNRLAGLAKNPEFTSFYQRLKSVNPTFKNDVVKRALIDQRNAIHYWVKHEKPLLQKKIREAYMKLQSQGNTISESPTNELYLSKKPHVILLSENELLAAKEMVSLLSGLFSTDDLIRAEAFLIQKKAGFSLPRQRIYFRIFAALKTKAPDIYDQLKIEELKSTKEDVNPTDRGNFYLHAWIFPLIFIITIIPNSFILIDLIFLKWIFNQAKRGAWDQRSIQIEKLSNAIFKIAKEINQRDRNVTSLDEILGSVVDKHIGKLFIGNQLISGQLNSYEVNALVNSLQRKINIESKKGLPKDEAVRLTETLSHWLGRPIEISNQGITLLIRSKDIPNVQNLVRKYPFIKIRIVYDRNMKDADRAKLMELSLFNKNQILEFTSTTIALTAESLSQILFDISETQKTHIRSSMISFSRELIIDSQQSELDNLENLTDINFKSLEDLISNLFEVRTLLLNQFIALYRTLAVQS